MATRAHTVPRFYLAGFTSPMKPPGHDPFLFVGSVTDGSVVRRAPKNLSIARGFYDGPGGFEDLDASVETHLSRIEWAAASAIRLLASSPVAGGQQVPSEFWRFIAWQAARTPAWVSIEEGLTADWDPNDRPIVVEPPPPGMEYVKDRVRKISLHHQGAGESIASTWDDYKNLFGQGWRWVPDAADRLEMIHMQAWYFQVRHFPRLHWRLIAPPEGLTFITSDRGISWSANGEYHVSPSALRHRSAEVIAPLTATRALIGRATAASDPVSAEEVNARIALSAVSWVAGSTELAVVDALRVRSANSQPIAGTAG
jgi:Protein of unknown function (DUF4238)